MHKSAKKRALLVKKPKISMVSNPGNTLFFAHAARYCMGYGESPPVDYLDSSFKCNTQRP
jgi:hypothetical protein